MRVRPERSQSLPDAIREPQELRGPDEPQFIGSRVIEPFLASGGASQFLTSGEGPGPVFSPVTAGIQLVAHHYVPQGQFGFVKELFIAPLCPPMLGEPLVPNSWSIFPAGDPWRQERATEASGYYRTPLAWQSMFDPGSGFPPEWSWQLQIIPGNPIAGRPAFNIADASTWYLTPNVAVPVAAYPQGVPGVTVWKPQAVQVTPEMVFETHVPVPPNNTVALFARWRQTAFLPQWRVIDAPADPQTWHDIEAQAFVFPIQPSVGRLHGYQQASASGPAVENAQLGW
jgi:hypothetical protein